MASRKPKATVAAEEMSLECMAGRLRKIDRAVTKIYDEALRDAGIKVTQLTILGLVAYLDEARPAQLEQYLLMDKSTVSRNVRRMREQGWLSTVPSEDGRGHSIVVAPLGEEILEAALPAWRDAQRRMKTVLDEGDRAALMRIADSIHAAIE